MATHKIPIEISTPSSDGNAYPLLVDFNPNRQILPALVKDVDGSWFGKVRVPENYVGTPKIEVGILANATTGNTRLVLGTFAIAFDGASWDGSFTDETAQDITVPGTAYNDKLVTFPTSGSLSTSADIAAGKWLFVRLQHNGTHANDTLAADTILGGLYFSYSDV